jgi:hypothetical protein
MPRISRGRVTRKSAGDLSGGRTVPTVGISRPQVLRSATYSTHLRGGCWRHFRETDQERAIRSRARRSSLNVLAGYADFTIRLRFDTRSVRWQCATNGPGRRLCATLGLAGQATPRTPGWTPRNVAGTRQRARSWWGRPVPGRRSAACAAPTRWPYRARPARRRAECDRLRCAAPRQRRSSFHASARVAGAHPKSLVRCSGTRKYVQRDGNISSDRDRRRGRPLRSRAPTCAGRGMWIA